jgi:hypothetical protein
MPMRFGKYLTGVIFSLAMGMSLASAAEVNLVLNGGFESGNFVPGNVVTGDNCEKILPGDTSISNWSVISADVAWCANGNPYSITASTGNMAVDLTGYNAGLPNTLQQLIPTVAGQSYLLEYDQSGLAQYGSSDLTFQLYNGANLLVSQSTHAPSPNTIAWQHESFSFTAQGPTLLSLVNTSSGDFVGLDNVSVTAIPEPTCLALIAISGQICLLRKRRRV